MCELRIQCPQMWRLSNWAVISEQFRTLIGSFSKLTCLFQNFSIEKGVFLGGHDEVVSLVLVVDDVLQGDAQLVVQVVEEVLQKKTRYGFGVWPY